jgi:hypothetical protein
MPISSFGIYAGIMIPVLFFNIIIFFPAIQILYDNKIQYWCRRKVETHEIGIQVTIDDHETIKGDEEKQETEESAREKAEATGLVKFFGGPFNDFVRKWKVTILLLTLVQVIITGYFAV